MKCIIAHRSMVVAFATLALAAGPVWGDSPHFIKSPTATIESDGSLDVTFKESGLGLGATDYVVQANATITCVCATSSGRCPNAANKSTGFTPVSNGATFTPKHGSVSQTINVPPPVCGTSAQPTCGGGQHFEVTDLTYSNIGIGDCTNTVPAGITCADTDSDGHPDVVTAGTPLAAAPSSLSASGLFVCK